MTLKRQKSPKFFCEHCGAEVGRDDKSCPVCGRFFSAVRCPRCGFSGSTTRFAHGCPVCGYSQPPDDLYPDPGEDEKHRQSGSVAPLPVWTWIVALVALVTAILALVSVL